jgi:pilus assembly protein CpaC
MQSNTSFSEGAAVRRVATAFLFGLMLLLHGIAPSAAQGTNDRTLVLDTGSGKVIHTGRPIANLFAADPKVAEVRPASPTSVFVFGVAVGRTTVAAFDEAGDMIVQYDVVVHPSGFASGEAKRMAETALPNDQVNYEATPNGLSLTGRVATPSDAERAAAIAKDLIPKDQSVDNRLAVDSAVQVNLRVRIAEIDRTVTRQLGINWSALGSIGRIGLAAVLNSNLPATNATPSFVGVTSVSGRPANAILDLLAQDNLATILAEPNLTARSGETASFLAGGEFPVPVAAATGSNNAITVEFKPYGVSLAFVPTVLSSDRISMRVRPEVSELTSTGSVSVPLSNTATVTIPGLTVRRAETTIELGSGQTFAIAGLISRNFTTAMSGLPYLGEIPVLGTLFKSDAFERDESELVILVTPYLVRPVSVASTLRTPIDGFEPPNDVDRILLLRQRARATNGDTDGRQLGDAGFLLN